jgi:hypothetical protein
MSRSRQGVTVKVNGVECLPSKHVSASGEVEVVIRVGKETLTFRTAAEPTLDQALWVTIRNRTHSISFQRYRTFSNRATTTSRRRATKSVQLVVSEAAVRMIDGDVGVTLD